MTLDDLQKLLDAYSYGGVVAVSPARFIDLAGCAEVAWKGALFPIFGGRTPEEIITSLAVLEPQRGVDVPNGVDVAIYYMNGGDGIYRVFWGWA